MLDMKPRCERCSDVLTDDSIAYICSYECTFCAICRRWFESRCPNCGTELVRRPQRQVETDRGERAPLL